MRGGCATGTARPHGYRPQRDWRPAHDSRLCSGTRSSAGLRAFRSYRRRPPARPEEAAGADLSEDGRGFTVRHNLLAADENANDGGVVAIYHARQPTVLFDALFGVFA